MPEPPAFQPDEPVRDKVSHDIGHVELVREDGMVYVRWKHQDREWVHASTIEHAPGFKRKRRPTP
jgi:hypothetical protein